MQVTDIMMKLDQFLNNEQKIKKAESYLKYSQRELSPSDPKKPQN